MRCGQIFPFVWPLLISAEIGIDSGLVLYCCDRMYSYRTVFKLTNEGFHDINLLVLAVCYLSDDGQAPLRLHRSLISINWIPGNRALLPAVQRVKLRHVHRFNVPVEHLNVGYDTFGLRRLGKRHDSPL